MPASGRLYYEKKLKSRGFNFIIGVDEAGRGPLAGPVVAAAVFLKSVNFKSRIDDSKKLRAEERERAFLEISSKSIFGIGIISERAIDQLNILRATEIAMERAILLLINKVRHFKRKRAHIIVDGPVNLDTGLPCTTIIGGDAKSQTIASASILAKVTRDRIMSLYDRVLPEYKFNQHKGYPTKEHRAILAKLGPSLIHRESFRGV